MLRRLMTRANAIRIRPLGYALALMGMSTDAARQVFADGGPP